MQPDHRSNPSASKELYLEAEIPPAVGTKARNVAVRSLSLRTVPANTGVPANSYKRVDRNLRRAFTEV